MPGATRTYRERSEVARPARSTSAAGLWWKDVKKRTAAIASAPKRLSSTELAGRAAGMFGAAAITRGAAVKAIMRSTRGRWLGEGPGTKTPWGAIRELIRVPRKELSRINEVGTLRGENAPMAAYDVAKQKLLINPKEVLYGDEIWHELVHGRQYSSGTAKQLMPLRRALRETKSSYLNDPLEIHARAVAREVMEKIPKGRVPGPVYDEVYDRLLRKSIMEAKNFLKRGR